MHPLSAPHRHTAAAASAVSPAALPAQLSDDTVRAVVTRVALETVAECTGQASPGHGVEHLDTVTSEQCESALECLSMSSLLGLEPALAGHLHRAATGIPGPTDRPTGLPVVLDMVAALIASRVARDLLDVRLARALHDVAHLEVARDSNRSIGVAMGVLMATRRCTEPQAFDLLRVASQNQNRKLRDIAAEVPFTGTILDPAGGERGREPTHDRSGCAALSRGTSAAGGRDDVADVVS